MKGRTFDNTHCINFASLRKSLSKKAQLELKTLAKHSSQAIDRQITQKYAVDIAIANQVFMEIPDQFVKMVKLGLLPENDKVKRSGVVTELSLATPDTVNVEQVASIQDEAIAHNDEGKNTQPQQELA